MQGTSQSTAGVIRPRLLDRRRRLVAATGSVADSYLAALLSEIDAALDRVEAGSYGLCETCNDAIEADRLAADPLARFCLDHMNESELRAHERDLNLATSIQRKLLPPRALSLAGWETFYHYEPMGPVGGDYCDVAEWGDKRSLFFAIGDVAGKGVSASLLMTHLTAILRSLLSLRLDVADLMTRANRLFCEDTLSTHYATLLCARACDGGAIEMGCAGQCPPILAGRGGVRRLAIPGLPLGMFCASEYPVTRVDLEPGESLVLYTDGVTDAQNPEGEPYTEERLLDAVRAAGTGVRGLADAVLRSLAEFRGTAPPTDDVTVLVVRRTP